MSKIFTRKKSGRGFSYYNNKNILLTDTELRKKINSLAIPPAWENVEITPFARKILAFGYDSKNRKQYIYNPKWVEKKRLDRFNKLIEFGNQLSKMRRVTSLHLRSKKLTKNKALACMVRLLDTAYFRPGNNKYSEENETYGLTTLRSKHVTILDDQIIFEYQGKHNKKQVRKVNNSKLIKVIKELNDSSGYQIFSFIDSSGNKQNLNNEDLNLYLKKIMGNKFSAKYFRTWAGTTLAAIALDGFGSCSEKQRSKNIVKTVKKVAKVLGNTEQVARLNYIDKKVFDNYLAGRTISYFKKNVSGSIKKNLTIEEFLVLKLLKFKV